MQKTEQDYFDSPITVKGLERKRIYHKNGSIGLTPQQHNEVKLWALKDFNAEPIDKRFIRSKYPKPIVKKHNTFSHWDSEYHFKLRQNIEKLGYKLVKFYQA